MIWELLIALNKKNEANEKRLSKKKVNRKI